MDELQNFANTIQRRFGPKVVAIWAHKDKGHQGGEKWAPNYHAHFIFDWINHDTGRTFKLGKDAVSRIQDVAAECLSMERGTPKALSNAIHLDAEAYRRAAPAIEAAKKLAEDKKAEVAELEKQIKDLKKDVEDLSASLRELREVYTLKAGLCFNEESPK